MRVTLNLRIGASEGFLGCRGGGICSATNGSSDEPAAPPVSVMGASPSEQTGIPAYGASCAGAAATLEVEAPEHVTSTCMRSVHPRALSACDLSLKRSSMYSAALGSAHRTKGETWADSIRRRTSTAAVVAAVNPLRRGSGGRRFEDRKVGELAGPAESEGSPAPPEHHVAGLLEILCLY
eukprot:5585892-Pleurochrysis_carterae.AAC.1